MALSKLACDAGVEKRLSSKKLNSEEERVEELIIEDKISKKFLSGLDQRLREDKV